jgi:HEAT repeat protein
LGKTKQILNKIINVTEDEWARINLSWLLQFLYKIAYIIAWIVLIALFVTTFGILNLPYFFLIYAVLRIIGAYFYSNILHKIQKDKLILYTALIGAVMLLFALFVKSSSNLMFIFISIPVLSVFLSQLYILNSAFIEDLFTPLESERTFPIIESAETVGGIVGAVLMVFLTPIIPVANLLNISVVCLALTAPLILFHRTLLQRIPMINFRNNQNEKPESQLVKIKKLLEHFKVLPFLKILFIVMILQWIFMHLLEFQFTKAVYNNISSNIHNPAEELTHGLSSLNIFFFSFALLMQIFVASRIISSLGVVSSLLLHPVVTLFSLGAMLFRFGFPSAVLAKLNFEMTSIIQKSAYHTSYYAITPKIREDAREIIEGFSQPIGTIIAMTFLIGLQIIYKTDSINMVITGFMILIVLLMLLILLKNENKYSHLSVKNLLHSNNAILQLNAIEVLGQKGHKNSAQILVKTLKEKNLDSKVKVKILETLGHKKEHESVLEVLDYISDEDRKVRIAALKALNQFDVIKKKSSKRLFSLHRINTLLKEQFEKEEDNLIKALIITILAKLKSEQIVNFILHLLKSDDVNIKSNCIAACADFDDINLVHYLNPYIYSDNPEIKGNAIIALWKYPKCKIKIYQELKRMLFSENGNQRIKAFYVVGEIKALQEKNRLKDYLSSDDEDERLTAAIALCKMNSKAGIDIICESLINSDDLKRERILHEIELLSDSIKRNITKNLNISVSTFINDILSASDAENLDKLDKTKLIKLRNAYELVNEHEEVQNINDILTLNPNYNGTN